MHGIVTCRRHRGSGLSIAADVLASQASNKRGGEIFCQAARACASSLRWLQSRNKCVPSDDRSSETAGPITFRLQRPQRVHQKYLGLHRRQLHCELEERARPTPLSLESSYSLSNRLACQAGLQTLTGLGNGVAQRALRWAGRTRNLCLCLPRRDPERRFCACRRRGSMQHITSPQSCD